jgi:hypothetical protein
VFTVMLVLSAILQWYVAPWNLLPSSAGLEFKDPEGELAIPIDLLGEEPPAPPPEPPSEPAPPTPSPDSKDPTAAGKPDASAPKILDAGDKLALSSIDGGADLDGAVADAAPHDAAASEEAGVFDDAGLVASAADAGGAPGGSGPRDPQAMFGLSKVVNAGVQNIVLGVNVALIRKHPVGSRMGPILQQIPQWKDFMKGAPSPIEPIHDTEWILIYGPSLIHTDRDAVLVRYNLSDETVDATVAAIAKTYDKGGPFDAGVPGVKGSLGYADQASRVFLRPQSKLLVIVPPSHAHEAALTFRKQTPRGPPAKEAMRLIVKNPANQVAIPGLKFSNAMSELRLWIIPRDDGGADVYVEGDCADEAAAIDSAEHLNDLLKRQNSIGVKFATRGLLNKATVLAEGTKITLHVDASVEQLEAVLQLVGAAFNAPIAPPTSAPGPNALPAPAPRPTPRAPNE